MAEIILKTNGTVEETVLTVDGVDVTKEDKIISINFYAHAPYVSSYSGDTINGYVSVGYDKANDDGTIESKTLMSGKTSSTTGVGQKIKSADHVVRYIDQAVDNKIVELVDKIISHSEVNKLVVPDRATLLCRTEVSLKDKCEDLGINLT